jgi:hypothetical protein
MWLIVSQQTPIASARPSCVSLARSRACLTFAPSTRKIWRSVTPYLRALGYSEKTLFMEGEPLPVGGPGRGATNGIGRYFYEWLPPPRYNPPRFVVAAEVDAHTRTLKSLYIRNEKLWRDLPVQDLK